MDSSMKNKVILVDIDGVALDWEYPFSVYMEEHGFSKIPGHEYNYDIGERYDISKKQANKLIKIFNESAAIGFLPPLRDSMHYVKKLHQEYGYVFHAITSLSTNPNAVKLREMNLRKLFGKTAFEKITCLETGADKDQALSIYKNTGCYWIEDKIKNAEDGAALGLNALLMEHGHNLNYYNEKITMVKNWKEIFQIITKQSE
jgi:hypothetical protein